MPSATVATNPTCGTNVACIVLGDMLADLTLDAVASSLSVIYFIRLHAHHRLPGLYFVPQILPRRRASISGNKTWGKGSSLVLAYRPTLRIDYAGLPAFGARGRLDCARAFCFHSFCLGRIGVTG